MDFINNKTNDLNLKIEKKIKRRKQILIQNNYNNNNRENCISEEFDKEWDKSYSNVIQLSTDPKLIEENSDKSQNSENRTQNTSDIQKSKSKQLLTEFINLFAKSLKVSGDFIHERYVAYSNQSLSQRDSTKTEYTYAFSFSYNSRLDPTHLWDWSVPNMSRKSAASVKSSSQSSSTFSRLEINNSKSISSEDLLKTESEGVGSLTSAKVYEQRHTPMFTRSHCLGGVHCEAGCEVHKKVRRRAHKSTEVVVPHSGYGLEPEIEFSDDDDYALNNTLNYQKLDSFKQNGFGRHHREVIEDSEEEEDITIVRKVTNIFRTSIYHTSKFIDSVTPNNVKRVTKKCPLVWFLLLSTALLGPFAYLMSQYFSSPLSENSIEDQFRTSDISNNYAINQMIISELKLIKDDLKQLKNSDIEMKSKISDNEFDGNDKYTKLNNKIDSIEDYIINVMKNCCKNETDQMLALIDSRLAAFMSSMLTENKNGKQSLSPSEAALELKSFIQLELSKTNENLKETIEQRLMSTIETFEKELSQNTNTLSSNLSIDEIKSLIRQALAIYDADKTGQPDFALEPAGGTVINTRCSETFDPYGVQYRILGMPVWSSSISPRAVIQPTITPGECWAFKGSQGYLVIKLSQLIVPTAFSYEHIPKQISRDGNIDSAPKEFQVRGLDDESDTKGHLLGNYVYEDNDIPMQHFLIQDPNPRPFQFIELVILSNHGHYEYTCLYRFRVHGKRVNY